MMHGSVSGPAISHAAGGYGSSMDIPLRALYDGFLDSLDEPTGIIKVV